MNATIDDLRMIRFPRFADASGSLSVYSDEGERALGMPIKRVFAVSGVPAGGLRGDHAHRWCTQTVVCLHGRVTITLDDARRTTMVVLDEPGLGVSIPPGIWNRLAFDGPDCVVIVFCDKPYDEADYLRDRGEYERLRGA